ncbi:Uncharacterised protein [Vibrio cholerae]|nr:Uncharacterised protein [Vibrio cholerae]CSI87973.1 Uncharacterised protein [Vibrio cholerae]
MSYWFLSQIPASKHWKFVMHWLALVLWMSSLLTQ